MRAAGVGLRCGTLPCTRQLRVGAAARLALAIDRSAGGGPRAITRQSTALIPGGGGGRPAIAASRRGLTRTQHTLDHQPTSSPSTNLSPLKETKDTPDAPEAARKELSKLGPMSRDEKITALAFLVTVTLWIGGAGWGINSVAAATVGLTILLVTGGARGWRAAAEGGHGGPLVGRGRWTIGTGQRGYTRPTTGMRLQTCAPRAPGASCPLRRLSASSHPSPTLTPLRPPTLEQTRQA